MITVLIPALRQYHNSEYIRYVKDIVNVCEQNDAAALALQPQVTELAGTFTELDRLFAIERANVLTTDVQSLDERRDRALTGIRLYADSFAYHFMPEKAQASQVVVAGIDKYGKNLARLNYIAETEVIVSLADDFTTNAAMAAAMQTLNLQDWVDELKNANTAFNDQYINRSRSNAAQPDGDMTEVRQLVTEKYRALADNIFARMVISPSVKYDNLVKDLNEITAQYNLVITNRSSNGDADLPVAAPTEQP
jgi:hypothetical protein